MNSFFIFLLLVIFPFGQIIKIGYIQPIDVVVGLGAVYSLFFIKKRPAFFKYLKLLLIFAAFSWILSIFTFQSREVFYGFLYLLRLASYIYFYIYIWNFLQANRNRKLVTNSLLAVSVISAFFGWIQFFTFSDLKPLYAWNWDMHLYRLAGTFLDPTYIGLIIVFGLIISINRLIEIKSWKYFLIVLFLIISLAFTYSRASYLAFFTALIVIGIYKKFLKKILILVITFALMTTMLPTSRNHSIELFRSFSIINRMENYKTTLTIFSQSPLFGIGYNNMCLAYNKFIGYQKQSSHACSGSDSSLLLILATTGIVGFIIFANSIWCIAYGLKRGPYHLLLSTSFVALMIHSLFSNSLFYSWILVWIIILLAEVDGN